MRLRSTRKVNWQRGTFPRKLFAIKDQIPPDLIDLACGSASGSAKTTGWLVVETLFATTAAKGSLGLLLLLATYCLDVVFGLSLEAVVEKPLNVSLSGKVGSVCMIALQEWCSLAGSSSKGNGFVKTKQMTESEVMGPLMLSFAPRSGDTVGAGALLPLDDGVLETWLGILGDVR